MNKLLPCPFCGGESLLRERYVNGIANTKHYRRECCRCKATFANWYRSIKKANEAWNRRANISTCDISQYAESCEECGFCVQQENKPLTLDELYQVDNEPLYIFCTVGKWSVNGWHIVRPINYTGIGLINDLQLDNDESNIIDTFNYGITWLAYRAKPERSEG